MASKGIHHQAIKLRYKLTRKDVHNQLNNEPNQSPGPYVVGFDEIGTAGLTDGVVGVVVFAGLVVFVVAGVVEFAGLVVLVVVVFVVVIGLVDILKI